VLLLRARVSAFCGIARELQRQKLVRAENLAGATTSAARPAPAIPPPSLQPHYRAFVTT